MTKQEIYDLISELDHSKPREIQLMAMDKLVQLGEEAVDSLADLNTPTLKKSCRYNAAIVLTEIGYPGIKNVIPDLLNWFLDINRPGTFEIMDLFKTIEKENLINPIEDTIEFAYKHGDGQWLGNLNLLVEELDMAKNDFKRKELFDIIKKGI
jgi:hypothetical protein